MQIGSLSTRQNRPRVMASIGRSLPVFIVGILVNSDAIGWLGGCISYLGAQLTLGQSFRIK